MKKLLLGILTMALAFSFALPASADKKTELPPPSGTPENVE